MCISRLSVYIATLVVPFAYQPSPYSTLTCPITLPYYFFTPTLPYYFITRFYVLAPTTNTSTLTLLTFYPALFHHDSLHSIGSMCSLQQQTWSRFDRGYGCTARQRSHFFLSYGSSHYLPRQCSYAIVIRR